MKDKKKIIIISCVVGLILLGIAGAVGYKLYRDDVKRKEKEEKQLLSDIKNSYNDYVIAKNDAKLYVLENSEYKEIGTISKGNVINLEEISVSIDTKYFKILGLDEEYYVSYKDVEKSEEVSKNKRYLNYIKLDKEIVTKDATKFYVEENLVYSFNKSFTLPVYIIDNDKYYVEYDGMLMYVLKEDIEEEKTVQSSGEYAKEIAVVAYHFVYDPANGEQCDQVICHSVTQFNSHLDYIKNNNFFTPTMEEFNLFMDGKIRLPKKSVMITIDDGWYAHNASRLLTEHKLNGTVFLITSAYGKDYVATEYVEAQSHTDDMHTQGICPGGQGGGIKCLDRQTILNDLRTSSEKLGGAIAVCYPFYEYNDYSISLVKEAGYKLGFAGYYAGGSLKARVGADKYQIPRTTMGNESTVDYLASIIN